MHIVGLQSVNIHTKKKKRQLLIFFQANIMDEAVAVEEYVFKCKY